MSQNRKGSEQEFKVRVSHRNEVEVLYGKKVIATGFAANRAEGFEKGWATVDVFRKERIQNKQD